MNDSRLSIVLVAYDDAGHVIEELPLPRHCEMPFRGAVWRLDEKADDGVPAMTVSVLKGRATACGFEARLHISDWDADGYIIIPGAAYNGNRFQSRPIPYPPILRDPADISPDAEPIVTDVPRLSKGPGASMLEQTTYDTSLPAMGWFHGASKSGGWLQTQANTSLGWTGLTALESDERDRLTLKLVVPAVRSGRNDAVPNWTAGDAVSLKFSLAAFRCESARELLRRYPTLEPLEGPCRPAAATLPHSVAWTLLEAKFNRDNWYEEGGYYSVGLRENPYQDWQAGWVGGGMATLALSLRGQEITKSRARRNLEFLMTSQTPSGLFHGMGSRGQWFGDGHFQPHAEHWHLIRKSADVAYYLLKYFRETEAVADHCPIPEEWKNAALLSLHAFQRLWDRYQQFGQFVDIRNGDIIVGGSAAGAAIPAALALGSVYFGDSSMMDAARQSALKMGKHFIERGYTNGGPGEILQAPDSESAYALLETLVVLYETTGETQWLALAEDMAAQFATWVVAYPFEFPATSEFHRLGMQTQGTVFANVQNKHSAPGICTASGDALLKLYRATGNRYALQLLERITRALPQYLSRIDRPIVAWGGRPMPSGWMNERVNLSDWEGKERIGEVFYGSCWSETAFMLTMTELPGIYVQPQTRTLAVLDHIDAQWSSRPDELLVHNPTSFDAEVAIWVDHGNQMDSARRTAELFRREAFHVRLLAGEKRPISLSAHPDRIDVQ